MNYQNRVFSNNLNHILLSRHLTQREVAEAIEVSPQTFNTWCQGIALPRMGKLQRLADYFGLNKSDLIEDHSSVAPAPSVHVPSPMEEKLLDSFYQLSPSGQELLVDYADTLVSSGKYLNNSFIALRGSSFPHPVSPIEKQ